MVIGTTQESKTSKLWRDALPPPPGAESEDTSPPPQELPPRPTVDDTPPVTHPNAIGPWRSADVIRLHRRLKGKA